MRGMIIGIGVLAIAGVALVQPASAEELVVRGPGVGIAVGEHHRDRDVIERRVHREHIFARGECKTIIIHREGMTKKIRKCD
jgi:hypothetical protein